MSEWIKVESSTPQKPEVVKMSRILGRPRSQVFGALVMVWCWFDRNSVDGAVDGMVSTDVDEISGLKGFSGAMQAVGWLTFDDSTQRITIPNFERHNGESAKKRGLKSDRQSRWRDAHVDAPVDVAPSTRVDKKTVEIHPPSPLKGAGRWWETETATLARAKELNVGTRPGESWNDLRQRIREAATKATTPTHARGNGSAPPPALDPDQGHIVKPKGKFDDQEEEPNAGTIG